MSTPITLLGLCHVREVAEYCPAGVQGTVLGIAVDLSALPDFLRLFPGPYRAGVPSRSVPVGSDCASRRGAVSRGLAFSCLEKRVGVESGVWPSLPVGEAVRRRAGVGSGRRSSSARPSDRRLDHPSGLSSRYFGPAHELRVARNVVCWAEPLLGSRSMRDPGFMNPTGAPDPLGDSGRIVWGVLSAGVCPCFLVET